MAVGAVNYGGGVAGQFAPTLLPDASWAICSPQQRTHTGFPSHSKLRADGHGGSNGRHNQGTDDGSVHSCGNIRQLQFHIGLHSCLGHSLHHHREAVPTNKTLTTAYIQPS